LSAQWMVVGAVDGELRELRSRMEGTAPRKIRRGRAWQGAWQGTPFLLVKTGMGPRRARTVVRGLLEEERFRGILSIGYAGALREGWRVGDLIVPEEIVTLPPLQETRHRPDLTLSDRIRAQARARGWPVHGGRMATSNRVVCSADEKRRCGERYGAGSVEMESAVLAELADRASVPLVVIRVVSDEVSFSLPESLALLDHIRRRRVGKIARCLALEPIESWKFLRMMRNARRASRALTRALLEVVMGELDGGDVPR